ncbi:MAG: hypothetical protein ACLSDO_02850 [Anaerotruncus colihominis]
METITIYIGGTAHRIPYEAPRTLSAFLEPYGFPMPCGGAHTCGKCKVAAYALAAVRSGKAPADCR